MLCVVCLQALRSKVDRQSAAAKAAPAHDERQSAKIAGNLLQHLQQAPCKRHQRGGVSVDVVFDVR